MAIPPRPAEVRAVIAFAEGDDLGAVARALHLPVLAGELEGALDGVRAAVAEVHGADPIRRHQVHEPLRELDGARVRGAAEGVVERQLIDLRDDRIADLTTAEAEIGAPQATDAIDEPMTID